MIYLEEAWRVLLANRVRSILTMLGLIIGVGAVIAIQVLGTSTAGAVNGALGVLQDNTIVIFPNARQRDVARASLRLRDLDAIRTGIDGIVAAQPLGRRSFLVRSGHASARFDVSPEGAHSFVNLPAKLGRKISQDDEDGALNVAVLSDAAFARLFPSGGDPIGTSLYAGPYRYVIVGVLQAPKRGFLNAQFGGDIRIPWTTFVRQYVRGDRVFAAGFVVGDPARIPQTEIAILAKLKELRQGSSALEYQTLDKASFTQGINGIFGAMTLIVALIGAVSLVVAGIGIMNIMLVSVAERTREIGIRKAIGARRGQILAQFFIEALLLCATGCAIGLVIGLGLGAFVNEVFLVQLTGTVTPIPWLQAIAIAAAFAAVVTLAFGTYPAYRAAGLDPIEALRYE